MSIDVPIMGRIAMSRRQLDLLKIMGPFFKNNAPKPQPLAWPAPHPLASSPLTGLSRFG